MSPIQGLYGTTPQLQPQIQNEKQHSFRKSGCKAQRGTQALLGFQTVRHLQARQNGENGTDVWLPILTKLGVLASCVSVVCGVTLMSWTVNLPFTIVSPRMELVPMNKLSGARTLEMWHFPGQNLSKSPEQASWFLSSGEKRKYFHLPRQGLPALWVNGAVTREGWVVSFLRKRVSKEHPEQESQAVSVPYSWPPTTSSFRKAPSLISISSCFNQNELLCRDTFKHAETCIRAVSVFQNLFLIIQSAKIFLGLSSSPPSSLNICLGWNQQGQVVIGHCLVCEGYRLRPRCDNNRIRTMISQQITLTGKLCCGFPQKATL